MYEFYISMPIYFFSVLVYEGGMKIWECSLDLVKYLSETVADLHGKKVLELGCGAGLDFVFWIFSQSSQIFSHKKTDKNITRTKSWAICKTSIFLMSVSHVRENMRELRENSKHKIRTAALPGLFCLKNGLISDLHLQDFNPEVIEHITKPNVALNQCSNSKIPRTETRFFSGM